MKNLNTILFFVVLVLSTIGLNAQVVTLQPTFVSQTDSVTVIYDASLGNGELAGTSIVYAHTGVITNASSTNTDWRHVQGNWGTADAKVEMTPLGNDRHMIKYHINSFYSVPANEVVYRLAFVFRDQAGNKVGRASDGSDIFVDLYQGGYEARFTSPEVEGALVDPSAIVDLKAEASEASTISIYLDGTLINQANNSKLLNTSVDVSNYAAGKHRITMQADNGAGSTAVDSFYYVTKTASSIGTPPSGITDGINYHGDTAVTLQLIAPFKQFVYVLGDFNNWEFDPAYQMKKSPTGERWFLRIGGLTPGKEYRYQYSIDDEDMRVADVYAEKYLDPWNDKWIPDSIYPNLIPYPDGKGSNFVSVMHPGESEYQWDNSINYTKPAKENLIVYELLIRDFIETHDYQGVIDSLDYLENLGINAIQLMPIMEFEGNESWGYNPAFFFAPDKYYGTKNDLKKLVEECHRRNIAVILDIALNHSFGQNPQVRMYFDASAGQYGQPTANNPWFNPTARHDFNVGYDYNHESQYTREFSERVFKFWIEEYRVDGYRLDLSKGFTQNNTLGNIGAWNAYDQSRVNILNNYANAVWSVDPTAYMILEHLSDNSEESALANQGFMLWGIMHDAYKEASLGFSSDFGWADYQARGYNDPHAVVYAVSHDEERLMYENYNFGNFNTGYNLTQKATALKRQEAIAAFLMGIPGPKMIWQFDEMGYDYSINYCPDGTINPDCRTANKPIRWDYLEEQDRWRLMKAYSAIMKLKKNEPAFSTTNYNLDVAGSGKRIHLNHASMDVAIVGNFHVIPINMIPGFQSTGWWYDYFTGDSINVTDLNAGFDYMPGEFKIYTSKKVETPDFTLPDGSGPDNVVEQNPFSGLAISGFPNPFSVRYQIDVDLQTTSDLTIEVFDVTGRKVKSLADGAYKAGEYAFYWDGENNAGQRVEPGMYFYTVTTPSASRTVKVMFTGN